MDGVESRLSGLSVTTARTNRGQPTCRFFKIARPSVTEYIDEYVGLRREEAAERGQKGNGV